MNMRGGFHDRPTRRQSGVSMVEVLVTMIIIAIGLLGVAGLQARLQLSEMESFQRSQALMLLRDMADRITTNRQNAADYVSAATFGTGHAPNANCGSLATLAARDLCGWSHDLQGAAEAIGANRVGAMVGARGCVQQVAGVTNEFLVTVAWQGLAPLGVPAAGVTCGANAYTGGNCTGERCRRTVTTLVRIADVN